MQHFGVDGLGSVRQIFDASAIVVGSSRYDPCGTVMSQYGTATSVFAFAGEQQDATGLTYLRARYYSSAQGRFTTRDVWAGDPNAPMSYNAWLYVYANPINGTDPAGLQGPTACPPPYKCLPTRTPWPTPTRPPTPTPRMCVDYQCVEPQKYSFSLKDFLIKLIEDCAGDKQLKQALERILVDQETPNGYMVGSSLSITDEHFERFHPKVQGKEVVYDFKHQEKAVFEYSSTFAESSMGIGLEFDLYESLIWGFEHGIEQDYSGPFAVAGNGVGTWPMEVGGGVTYFSSVDPLTACEPDYKLIGIGVSGTVGGGISPKLPVSGSHSCTKSEIMNVFGLRLYQKYPKGELGAAIMQAELESLHLPLAKEAQKYVGLYEGAK